MNKRGQAFPVWTFDPPRHHRPETVSMYTSIPFYLGLHIDDGTAYGVLIDHTGMLDMDIGHTNDTEVTMTLQGDRLTAYLFAGPIHAHVLSHNTTLTGSIP